MTMESKKKYKHVTKGRHGAVFMTHFFRGMGAPVEFWSCTFLPKTYPGDDIQHAWSDVGSLLTEAVREFDQKESA